MHTSSLLQHQQNLFKKRCFHPQQTRFQVFFTCPFSHIKSSPATPPRPPSGCGGPDAAHPSLKGHAHVATCEQQHKCMNQGEQLMAPTKQMSARATFFAVPSMLGSNFANDTPASSSTT